MFSGIIKDLGKLQKKEGSIFTFKAPHSLCQKLEQGLSISINGACLTVLNKTAETFAVEIMPETDRRAMFGSLRKDAAVNLELPVTPETFLSGHIVQGHIDGVGKVTSLTKDKNSKILTVSYPVPLAKYVVEKGSIALHGISLTIIEAEKDFFTVGIIPHTWNNTLLHTLKIGSLVNIEVDILAKYVERLCIK